MRNWILPLVLVVIAAFAWSQAVRTDSELAEAVVVEAGQVTEAPLSTPLLSVRRTPEFLREPLLVNNLELSLIHI